MTTCKALGPIEEKIPNLETNMRSIDGAILNLNASDAQATAIRLKQLESISKLPVGEQEWCMAIYFYAASLLEPEHIQELKDRLALEIKNITVGPCLDDKSYICRVLLVLVGRKQLPVVEWRCKEENPPKWGC